MKYKLLVVCLFISLGSLAQYSITTDTTKFVNERYKDSGQIKNHLDYVFENFRGKNENQSLATTIYLLNKAVSIKNIALEASAFNIMGSIYNLTGKFDKAIANYLKAIQLFEITNNMLSLATMYNNIGMIYNNTQQFKLAMEYFNKGLVISSKNHFEKTKALININLTNLYIQNNALDKALMHALIADSLTKKLKMSVEEAVNANLIGAIYFYKNNFIEAIKYYEISKSLAARANDLHSENTAKLNIGEAQIQLKNNHAEKNLLESLHYFESISDNYNIQLAANLLKEFYLNGKNFQKALEFSNKSFAAEKRIMDSVNYKTFSSLQTKYETQQKENKIVFLSQSDSIKSLKISNQQLALSGAKLQLAEDSILLFAQNQTILKNQLDSALKSDQINSLSKQALTKELLLQKQSTAIKQKNNLLIITVISVLLLVVIAYALYKRKQLEQKMLLTAERVKQRQAITEAVIEAEETERKRIAADLHDGVGQLFSAVKMNLQALFERVEIPKQEDHFLAEKTMALVDESCKEVRVISHKMMPNFLLKSGIASDIRSFIEKIDEHTLKIKLETKGFKDQLEFNEEVILYRVIQELINNVIKHANANELYLLLERSASYINVVLSDNGIGFNYEDGKNKGGLGLKNIAVRINYLKGQITFSANQPKGTKVHIQIPVA
ncbi:tetratricopeptide repeat-containing sensor histidine kinase [Sediminibacterium sp.]|uniref:tetratricopeptide repeat-containing sensor histidine kinase n=1 Tax=Sediminibacterium sp. TaxID=1917865 RepID=UPI003F721824